MSLEEIMKLKSKLSPAKQKILENRLRYETSPRLESKSEEIYVSSYLNISKHWILNEHRNMGKATVPGTAYIEMARAAFEQHAQFDCIEIRELYFLTPLVVEEYEEKEVRTLLKKQGDGFEFLVCSPSKSGSEEWDKHTIGKIVGLETQPAKKYEIHEIEANCNLHYIAGQEFKIKSDLLERGARWNNVKWIKTGINKGLALLEMPDVFTDDIKSYKLHPALLDTATAFMINQFPDGGLYLPFSYAKLRIKGALPLNVYSYIKAIENNHSQTESLSFNITIMDEHGTELVEIEEYTLRKLRN